MDPVCHRVPNSGWLLPLTILALLSPLGDALAQPVLREAGTTPAAIAPTTAATGSAPSPLYLGAVLFDQLEYRSNGRGGNSLAWQGLTYFGTAQERIFVNTRGETNQSTGNLERAEAQVLYSRLLGYFWDIQAGVRQDLRIQPRSGSPGRTYGVLGLQGLAPGFFQVQAHAFLGERGVLLARVTATYDLFITNRLVLQPEVEANVASGWDRQALISPGVYRVELGIRLRYEITRELAPYIGFSHERRTGGAAGLSRRTGEKPEINTAVAGIRLFF